MRFVSRALSVAACVVLVARAATAQPAPDATPDAGTPPPPSGEAPPPDAAPAEPAPPPTEPAPPPEAPPPAAASPPASPPVTTAPVSGTQVQPTATPGTEAGTSKPKQPSPPETTLAVELDVGLQRRMGDSADYGFETREPGGMAFGPGLWLAPARLWSVGLSYRRIGLGSDRSGPGEDSLSVRRRLDALWLGGRAYPWRTDSIGVYVMLELGMSWQHADADGTRATASFLRPAEAFACSGNSGPGFALGGGLGMDVDIERDLSFIAQVDATAHRHTSETIDSCAPGSGSVTNIGANIGFAYKFDLDPRANTTRGSSALLR